MERILRRETVSELVGVGRSTLYEMMRQGRFPRPVHINSRAVGWVASEIEDWIEARRAERDRAAA